MENGNCKDIQKQTFKINGKPMLSGYSFTYDGEEYLCVKNISSNETHVEGDYSLMKVIKGLDDKVGFVLISKDDPANALWTRIIDSLEEKNI